jgi:hypothetical protein
MYVRYPDWTSKQVLLAASVLKKCSQMHRWRWPHTFIVAALCLPAEGASYYSHAGVRISARVLSQIEFKKSRQIFDTLDFLCMMPHPRKQHTDQKQNNNKQTQYDIWTQYMLRLADIFFSISNTQTVRFSTYPPLPIFHPMHHIPTRPCFNIP